MAQWYYVDGDRQRQGPVEDAALVVLWRSGSVGLDTLVWRDGESGWRRLDDFRDVLALGNGAGPLPPPLPPAELAAPPRVQASTPPPRSGMSGCLIAVIVAAVLLVPGTAILVAIALPAYQDYTLRSKIASALSASAPIKTAVAARQAQLGRCPTDGDLLQPAAVEGLDHGHIASATLGTFESNLCGIELLIGGTGNESVDGKALWLEFQPAGGTWLCSSEIQDRYLPQDCRG